MCSDNLVCPFAGSTAKPSAQHHLPAANNWKFLDCDAGGLFSEHVLHSNRREKTSMQCRSLLVLRGGRTGRRGKTEERNKTQSGKSHAMSGHYFGSHLSEEHDKEYP